VLTAFCTQALAVECTSQTPVPTYTVCSVDAARLEVFWRDDKEVAFRDLPTLRAWLGKQGRQLVFATNAGAFDDTARPVGLLVSEGIKLQELSLRDGSGNMFEKPNGVFWVADGIPYIHGSEKYRSLDPRPRIATQSGPLLISGGRPRLDLHTFRGKSYMRSAACVDRAGGAKFVFSNRPVTIAELGDYMDKTMQCASALYMDGCRTVLFSRPSGLELTGECLNNNRLKVGPMLGIAEPVPAKD
jgi:uncharacterized protein YigE (DUF2233 family)